MSLLCAVALAAAPVAASADLPVKYRAPGATPADPDGPPAGANDWACRPTAAHPRPVILVPSTGNTMAMNWATLSPLLKNEGYCVFSLNYGAFRSPLGLKYYGGQPIESSAAELGAFADRVRAATGAPQVDLVGHSQGGILAEYYVKFLGGAPFVKTVVGLASPTKGGTLNGLLEAAENLRRVSPAVGNALWGARGGKRAVDAPAADRLAAHRQARQRARAGGHRVHEDRVEVRPDRDAVSQRLHRWGEQRAGPVAVPAGLRRPRGAGVRPDRAA
ncbi:esterase/lipase family protein [Svornostia abyssi]|uniref:esterase/lipase family protein n=1 Tax=Svornostia abyssi TaxID=2898438 RepID=UPI0038705827